MDLTADELAGIADVFGALTRSELEQALTELAFKHAEDIEDPEALIDDAVASYHLVGFDSGEERLLVPGPTAFPEIPENAEDLPHILDTPERDIDREQLTGVVADRFHEESVIAVRSGDSDTIDRLLDVSYELEVWGSVDVSGARDRLVETDTDGD